MVDRPDGMLMRSFDSSLGRTDIDSSGALSRRKVVVSRWWKRPFVVFFWHCASGSPRSFQSAAHFFHLSSSELFNG
jgi:hypothetical protein